MIDRRLLRLAFRSRAASLVVATTGSTTLSATASGYARALLGLFGLLALAVCSLAQAGPFAKSLRITSALQLRFLGSERDVSVSVFRVMAASQDASAFTAIPNHSMALFRPSGVLGRKLVAVVAPLLGAVNPRKMLALASLGGAVAHVVALRAKEKMCGVLTPAIVASVQNARAMKSLAAWHWPVRQLPGDAVGRNGFAVSLEIAIPAGIAPCSPFPAFGGTAYPHFRPEAIRYALPHERNITILSRGVA